MTLERVIYYFKNNRGLTLNYENLSFIMKKVVKSLYKPSANKLDRTMLYKYGQFVLLFYCEPCYAFAFYEIMQDILEANFYSRCHSGIRLCIDSVIRISRDLGNSLEIGIHAH